MSQHELLRLVVQILERMGLDYYIERWAGELGVSDI